MPGRRQEIIDLIAEDGDFDVIVVGGGINGIGVFHDLAHQRLRVLLVELNDFCSGCSAAPSRMIHGGLRYLENGDISLVRESIAERDRLLRNAPHFVRPLPTVIPIDRMISGMANAALGFLGFTGRPHPRGALPIRLGLMLYDAIAGLDRMLPKHRFLGQADTKVSWPALRSDIRCSAIYHDAWISYPERLGVELIGDAMAYNPQAVALNYAQLTYDGADYVLHDNDLKQRLTVRGKILVNATGAWIDQTARSLGATLKETLVSSTKGSHLILDNPALMAALKGHMVYYEHVDGRVCIVFPYLGRVLAGSTDLRVNEPSRTSCSVQERDYIIDALQALFPAIPIEASQIVYSYAGIRPLPLSSADFTGRISRRHELRRIDGRIPQIGMVGGKWTTYRGFAEDVADQVLKELGMVRQVSTRDMPIGGGAGFPPTAVTDLMSQLGVESARAKHLIDLYGTKAAAVAKFCGDQATTLLPGVQLSEQEISWFVRNEHALHLADVLQRRSPCAIRGDLSLPLILATARAMAVECGWTKAQTEREISQFLFELETYHGVRVTQPEGVPS